MMVHSLKITGTDQDDEGGSTILYVQLLAYAADTRAACINGFSSRILWWHHGHVLDEFDL